jgi:CcmD family protein
VRNYAYLFWGYSVVWLGIAGYVLVLLTRLGRLRRRIEGLEREVGRLAARTDQSV